MRAARFESAGLISKVASATDGRSQQPHLTPHGRAVYEPLGQFSEMLSRFDEAQQLRLLGAMQTIAELLDQQSGMKYAHSFVLRAHHPDDDDTLDCMVTDNRTGKILAQLSLAECGSAGVQVDDGHILLFDQAGRLIDVCCEDSAVHVLTLGRRAMQEGPADSLSGQRLADDIAQILAVALRHRFERCDIE